MVRHHVAERAGLFIETAALFDADGFGRGDLHVVDVIAIPDRLEEAVGKSNCQDALDGFLAEKMIDAINLLFVPNLEQSCVQRLGGVDVVTERLLDDDAPPAFAARFIGQPRAGNVFCDRTEETVGDGEIEQHVAARPVVALDRIQQLAELGESLVLIEIALEKRHLRQQFGPRARIDGLGLEFAAACQEALHHFGQAFAPLIGRAVVMIHTDQREILREQLSLHEVVERRNDEALRQVARRAEYDHRARAGRLGLRRSRIFLHGGLHQRLCLAICSRAALMTCSDVNPNLVSIPFSGAEAPNLCIPIIAPRRPT